MSDRSSPIGSGAVAGEHNLPSFEAYYPREAMPPLDNNSAANARVKQRTDAEPPYGMRLIPILTARPHKYFGHAGRNSRVGLRRERLAFAAAEGEGGATDQQQCEGRRFGYQFNGKCLLLASCQA